MAKASTMWTSFTSGEFSPLLDGHINLDKFNSSARKIQNLIALKQGPLVRRGGTVFVSEVKNSAHNTILIPFEYSVYDSYIIEAGDEYLRFYKDNAPILDGGAPYEIVSPYAQEDLLDDDMINKIQISQSADVLYLIHPDYPPMSLARISDTDWKLSEMEFLDGPYIPENDTTTTLTLSGTRGSVTVTASSTVGINNDLGFLTSDIGRLIRWQDPANKWTWLKITARTSSTVVTATIKGADASAGTATNDWKLGVYNATIGYPKVITFFQDRPFLAGCQTYPDRWDLGRTSGYSQTTFNFAPSDRDGTVTDDASITGTLQSGNINTIQWAEQNSNGLVIGTSDREWLVQPSTSDEVLTQANSKAEPFSSIGSAAIKPVAIESGALFVQRARRKILDIIYSFEMDQLKPRDITLTSEHITYSGVAQLVAQQEPANIVWSRLKNGAIIGITYYPDEAVFAAHNHVIGGNDVLVKSITVIPNADNDADELWLIVSRTIDGETKQYIEYMKQYYTDSVGREDIIVMDSAITYSGVSTDTISGLDHLEGETVSLLVNGNSHPNLLVTSGSVTLANNVSTTKAQIGLKNTWILKTQRIEGGAEDGVAQGKTKRITGYVIRLLNSLGLKYGTGQDNYDIYNFTNGERYDETTPLFSGDTPLLRHPAGYEQDGSVYLFDDGVFPITILAIMPVVHTQDR